MSVLRILYEAEPEFPALDGHPQAERYEAGEFWVEAIGGEPGREEVDQVLEQLGRLVYQRRREAREKLAQQIVDRAKGHPKEHPRDTEGH